MKKILITLLVLFIFINTAERKEAREIKENNEVTIINSTKYFLLIFGNSSGHYINLNPGDSITLNLNKDYALRIFNRIGVIEKGNFMKDRSIITQKTPIAGKTLGIFEQKEKIREFEFYLIECAAPGGAKIINKI